MSQPTQTYKRSLSGSIGAGMGAVLNAKGRTYYILEHKVSSKYHRAGETQEIIVDQIEIGRDPKCQVRFDESFKTVSRRHAAIVRDGQNWKLIQLSNTNTTFLNGRPVQNEWYLQNGDEIQLSVNGPKLGFIVPSGNKSTVGSIGLSRRLSLFRQQALRPYKTAMAVLATLLVLAIAGGTGGGIYLVKENQKSAQIAADAQKQAADLAAKYEALQDSVIALGLENKDLKKAMKNLKKQNNATPLPPTLAPDNTFDKYEQYVYIVYIKKMVISMDGDTEVIENLGTGSGFLLDDGRFVTARHVIEPWMFNLQDKNMRLANAVANNGGSVVLYFEAYSPMGKLSFSSKDVIIDHSSDRVVWYDEIKYVVAPLNHTDWAYWRTGRTSTLSYDNTLSQTLKARTKLTCLGYSLGLGDNNEGTKPLYSEAIVARDGLYNGLILTTADATEQGCSGGPLFATTQKGEMVVVGLVSRGLGEHSGAMVPIAAVGR